MPHKHKRKRGVGEDYELPPTQNARPLPTTSKKQISAGPGQQAKPKRQRKDRAKGDDAPRQFKRLMAFAQGKKMKSGLDDGENTKQKGSAQDNKPETPRIRPGENMRTFAARVDAELPISGLATKTKTKDGKDSLGLKVQRTRKERKMHKLYDQWRAEERKIQDQREEEAELAAEKEMEDESNGLLTGSMFDGDDQTKGGKKSRKRRGKAQDDDDPWAELIKKRAEAKVGLHDVAQAPPELHKATSRKPLKVDGAAVDVGNIPKAAGSLRRREELQAARDDVVEAYRKIREHEQAKLDAQKKKR